MAATNKRTGQRQETVEKRLAILRAATDVFGAKGFYNGSLQDVAEQVGMTHAGILHHFGSKNHLLLEVLKYRDDADVEDKAGKHIPDGEALFRHLIETAFRNENRPGIVQAYAVLSAESVTEEHPARGFFEERYRVLRGEIGQAFRTMCSEKGVPLSENVDHAASSILAVMDGLQVQWLLDPTQVTLGETSRYAIEVLVSHVLGTDWKCV